MYPELVTRGDLEVFLPPIGGQTVYVFGDPKDLADPDGDADRARARRVQRLRRVRLRHLHVPALPHARDRGVHPRRAGRAASGLVVYCRKEGRALGEVTKFLVYNARKRQEGGDSREQLFPAHRVRRGRAGHALPGADARRAALARHAPHPSPRVDEQHEVRRDRRRAASRSASACRFPTSSIPADARVEMDAKKAAGYFTDGDVPDAERARARPRAAACDGGGRRRVAPSRRCSSPATIRERCAQHRSRPSAPGARATSASTARASTALRARVAAVTRRRYPDLAHSVSQPLAPFRGRRRRSRRRARRARCRARRRRRARARIDLAVVSVLLDAGAGPAWRYVEAETGQALHALGGPRRRELSRVHGRRVLRAARRSAARRCARRSRSIDAATLARCSR